MHVVQKGSLLRPRRANFTATYSACGCCPVMWPHISPTLFGENDSWWPIQRPSMHSLCSWRIVNFVLLFEFFLLWISKVIQYEEKEGKTEFRSRVDRFLFDYTLVKITILYMVWHVWVYSCGGYYVRNSATCTILYTSSTYMLLSFLEYSGSRILAGDSLV